MITCQLQYCVEVKQCLLETYQSCQKTKKKKKKKKKEDGYMLLLAVCKPVQATVGLHFPVCSAGWVCVYGSSFPRQQLIINCSQLVTIVLLTGTICLLMNLLRVMFVFRYNSNCSSLIFSTFVSISFGHLNSTLQFFCLCQLKLTY